MLGRCCPDDRWHCLFVVVRSIRFFQMVLHDFLFGIHWSPQSAFEGAGRGLPMIRLDFGAIHFLPELC